MSGIDVSTQALNQTYSEPFCALVIDPHRTITGGKVEIGAFRTYPADYTPAASNSNSQFQSIPLNKIEDFGVHANKYYQLEVEYFKSPMDDVLLDLLWEKYWISTLSQSNLDTRWNHLNAKIEDVSSKIGISCEQKSMQLLESRDQQKERGNIVKQR